MDKENTQDRTTFAEILPLIRRKLQARIYETSLRATAREVGMSSTGLSDMIEKGTAPYGKTVQKLLAWYTRHGAGGESEWEAREVGVELLTRNLSPRDLREGVARVIRRLADAPDAELLARVEAALEPPPPPEPESESEPGAGSESGAPDEPPAAEGEG